MARQNLEIISLNSVLVTLHPTQQGAVLLVLLLVFFSVSFYFYPNRASLTIAQMQLNLQTQRQQRLLQAKAALLGRALSDNNRHGSLPCPDNNGDGLADLLHGKQCPSDFGPLPWRTLGLDNHYRDLWYGLAKDFYDADTGKTLNSDENFTLLKVNGKTDVIALVIEPATDSPLLKANIPLADYLQMASNDSSRYIRLTEMMQWLEQQVLTTYRQAYSNYCQSFDQPEPHLWLMPFGNGTKATLGNRYGHLPHYVLGENFTTAVDLHWQIGTPTGEINDNFHLANTKDCIYQGLDAVDCEITETVTQANESTEKKLALRYWGNDTLHPATLNTLANRDVVFDLNHRKNKDFLFKLTVKKQRDGVLIDQTTVVAQAKDIIQLAAQNIAVNVLLPAWLVAADWPKQVVAVFAPEETPAGAGCIKEINCLQLLNSAQPNNDKKALLLLAGKKLDGQVRPSNNASDYFEQANADLSGLIFQQNAANIDFNDKITVLKARQVGLNQKNGEVCE